MSDLKHFKHHTPLQLRFADLDSLNHVNNANYLTYIELARIRYLEEVLGMKMDDPLCVILAKATVDYKLPILLKDDITVYTRCSRLGTKSFDLEYALVKNENGQQTVMATAHTILVAYNYNENSSMEVLASWREKMQTYDSVA